MATARDEYDRKNGNHNFTQRRKGAKNWSYEPCAFVVKIFLADFRRKGTQIFADWIHAIETTH
jgi:hypothetical protein